MIAFTHRIKRCRAVPAMIPVPKPAHTNPKLLGAKIESHSTRTTSPTPQTLNGAKAFTNESYMQNPEALDVGLGTKARVRDVGT